MERFGSLGCIVVPGVAAGASVAVLCISGGRCSSVDGGCGRIGGSLGLGRCCAIRAICPFHGGLVAVVVVEIGSSSIVSLVSVDLLYFSGFFVSRLNAAIEYPGLRLITLT